MIAAQTMATARLFFSASSRSTSIRGVIQSNTLKPSAARTIPTSPKTTVPQKPRQSLSQKCGSNASMDCFPFSPEPEKRVSSGLTHPAPRENRLLALRAAPSFEEHQPDHKRQHADHEKDFQNHP